MHTNHHSLFTASKNHFQRIWSIDNVLYKLHILEQLEIHHIVQLNL